jgi:hypothetical protein
MQEQGKYKVSSIGIPSMRLTKLSPNLSARFAFLFAIENVDIPFGRIQQRDVISNGIFAAQRSDRLKVFLRQVVVL